MLPRSRRLRAAEVKEVILRGKSARGRFLSAKFLRGRDGTIRAASVVSKTLARTAVERNRLRRALYRSLEHAAPPCPGLRVVFFLRTIPPEPVEPALRSDIESVLQSIGGR